MATSNAIFFAINEVPPLNEVGWQVTVANYSDFSTYVCDINDYISLNVSPVINEPGQGSITLSMLSPLWNTTLGNGLPASDLLEGEYLFQCWEDGILRFEFIGDQIEEDTIDSDEDPTVTISGPGTGAVLKWAELFPYQFPKPHPTNVGSLVNYDWDFKKKVAMSLFLKVLKASQSRGVIPYVKPTFTDKKDSAGVAWADIKNPYNYEAKFGTNLLDQLAVFTGQDTSQYNGIYADWYMRPKFKLDVRQTFGIHREGEVIFFDGDITSKKRSRDRSGIANYIALRDDYGSTSISYNPASISRWQKREHIEERDGLWDVPRRSGVTNVIQQQMSKEDSSWVIQIPYGRQGRKPFEDFDIGDWVGISTPSLTDWNKVEAYRVMAITIRVSVDTTEVELELESVWKNKKRKLDERIQQIIHTPPKGQVKIPNTVPGSKIPVVYDPNDGLIADPNFNYGGGMGTLWIQETDPALDKNNTVSPGDFWIQMSEPE